MRGSQQSSLWDSATFLRPHGKRRFGPTFPSRKRRCAKSGNPSSAAVGYVGAAPVNLALGGAASNFDPAVKELRKNDPIVPKQTSYARVVSGEIPILLDYDFDAYSANIPRRATSSS